jgi:DNA-binding transcriptional MerR regulator
MLDAPSTSTRAHAELRIGDLSRRTGIARATIEHYLRLGLVQPISLGDQGYRFFDEEAVDRLEAIRTGRRAGFTLNELRKALLLVDPVSLEQLLNTLAPARCRAELVARGVTIQA